MSAQSQMEQKEFRKKNNREGFENFISMYVKYVQSEDELKKTDICDNLAYFLEEPPEYFADKFNVIKYTVERTTFRNVSETKIGIEQALGFHFMPILSKLGGLIK